MILFTEKDNSTLFKLRVKTLRASPAARQVFGLEVPLNRARIRRGLTFSLDSVTKAAGVGHRASL